MVRGLAGAPLEEQEGTCVLRSHGIGAMSKAFG